MSVGAVDRPGQRARAARARLPRCRETERARACTGAGGRGELNRLRTRALKTSCGLGSMAASVARYFRAAEGSNGAANPTNGPGNPVEMMAVQQPQTELAVRMSAKDNSDAVATRGGGAPDVHVGVQTSIGRRATNEDRHAVQQQAGTAGAPLWLSEATFVGVYDGHGGAQCAQYCKEELHAALARETGDRPTAGELREGLARAFGKTDSAFLDMAEGSNCRAGTTAVVAVVTDSALAVAHVGDSRALAVYADTTAEFLTIDHKPSRPDEQRRIESAGGEVVNCQPVWRVSTKGASDWQTRCRTGRVAFNEQPPVLLAVSRAFGNKDLKRPKEIVTAVPETKVWALDALEKPSFVVLCTDGVWDVLSAERVAEHCLRAMEIAGGPCASAAKDAAATIVADAESNGSMDNCTAAVCIL